MFEEHPDAPEKSRGRWAALSALWARQSARTPWAIVLAAFVLAAVALPFAASLKLDTDIAKMLPEGLPVVEEMTTTEAKVGGVGYFSVIVEHDDTEESIRFVQDLAGELEGSEYVRAVFYENPVDFLREHQLLMVPLDKLEEMRGAVKTTRSRLNPFFVDLRTPEEKAADAKETEAQLDKVREMRAQVDGMRRYHTSEDGGLVAMQVRPRSAVTSIGRTRDMQRAMEAAIDKVKAEGSYSPEMAVAVSGSMRNKVDEYKVVVQDVVRSAWVSALLVLAVLLIVFRRPTRLVVLVLPLAVGLVWAFAVTGATIGYLNIITATLLVVLFGLGIDHGIHLVGRYTKEREKGEPVASALELMLAQTGRATVVSALTTALGFLVMIWADFKGFSHLGMVAGVSMVTVTAAYLWILPALLVLMERRGWWTIGQSKAPSTFWGRVGALLSRGPARFAMPVILAVMVAGGAAAVFGVSFNDNFETLLAKVESSREVRQKQRAVYTQTITPGAVMVAPDDATVDAIVAELDRRRAADTETPTIGRVMTLRDVIPVDQEARLAEIKAAAALISDAMLRRVEDDEQREWLETVRAAADLEPVTLETLPPQIRDILTPQDGSSDRLIFIYPTIERKQGDKARQFADDLAPITVDGTVYHATGDTLILATMLQIVIGQGAWIFVLALLTTGLLLWLQFGRIRRAGTVMIPLLGGLSLMAVMLVAFGVDLNFYNMAILGAVLGMGVDSNIHLYERWLVLGGRSNPDAVAGAMAGVGGWVTASMATTTVGYLALVFSGHPGIRSIGQLAFIGLSCTYVASVLLMPMLLGWLTQRRHRRPSGAP